MKRNLVTPLFFILSTIPCFLFAQVKSDLFRHNLKGKVHTTLESDYKPSAGSFKTNKKNLSHKEFIEYDEQGNIIQLKEYNSKDILTTTRKIISDRDGKRIMALDYDYNNQLRNIDSFKYDLHGNRVEDWIYNPDLTLAKRMLSKYDSNGVVIETYIYDSQDKLVDGYKFKIDSSGARLTGEYINKDSIVIRTNTYRYSDFDKEGNSRKSVCYYNGDIYTISTLKVEYY